MLSSAARTFPLSSNHHPNCHNCQPHKFHSTALCQATTTSAFSQRPLLLTANASSTTSSAFAGESEHSLQNSNSNILHNVSRTSSTDDSGDQEGGDVTVASASAVAYAIRKVSISPVDFVQKIDNDGKKKAMVLPSPDFQRLCIQQLDLFRRVVDPNAILSVYVRPAGSYVMDRLELRRVTFYPGVDVSDIVILIGNFSISTGLRAAEAALSNLQAEFIPDGGAIVFPMVKHPFVVGFLVAELSNTALHGEGHNVEQYAIPEGSNVLPPHRNSTSWEIQYFKDNPLEKYSFSAEQRLNAINISSSLAMAYVMDQKAMLLQQSSWQNNVRMSNLVEQIRGPLSSIRTLSKMLSAHMKRSEISYDIVQDILVQGDHMKDTLQQLQDAVYLTKVNIMHYNEEKMKKMNQLVQAPDKSMHSQLFSNLSNVQENGGPSSLSSTSKDLELPMPPLALAPLRQQGIRRPCNISDVLADLVGAVDPLACKQQRAVEFRQLSPLLQVAVEEHAFRQALGNLIEGALLRTHVGGKVEILSTRAPAGGALVIIDDDGPDMHYMTQMRSLIPFGADLLSEDMVEDNMTWNFVAGLTVARDILESYGSVVRVISPRLTDAALGTGGTRVELWLPSFSTSPYSDSHG